MGIPTDHGTALRYFTMAGAQGHLRALLNVGFMHLSGLGLFLFLVLLIFCQELI